MEKYICVKCEKIFSHKHHLENHLNKKNPCDNLIKREECENNKEKKIINAKTLNEYLNKCQCVYCEKKFTAKNSVLYHIKNSCKKVKEIEQEKQRIFEDLKKKEEENQKIRQLEEEIKKLKEEKNKNEKLKEDDNLKKKNKGMEKIIKEMQKKMKEMEKNFSI